MTQKVPSISEWFSNKNVFITGGTGFMGKILISKLLLTCPDVGDIFLLIRKKKDISPQAKLQLILQKEPFRILKEQYPAQLKKLIVINGDMTKEGLSLSAADKERLSRVSVVFHMAANVKFDLSLKTAVMENTVGTINIVALAKQMPMLESFIHVSTCFCHCDVSELEERAYPMEGIIVKDLINMITMMSDQMSEILKQQLLKDMLNTYAYSKALSEDLVSKCGLPIGIIRPSIVTASWKEPAPGWVDNIYGPTGLIIGGGKGVIRSMLCNANYFVDLVPCDIAVNATIALAWWVGTEKPNKPIFINATTDMEIRISWGDALDIGRKFVLKNPFSQLLWYPGGGITSSKIKHWFTVIFLQIIPAYFLDCLLFLTGNKPFLIQVQNRVRTGLKLLQYYTMKQWIFRTDNLRDLQQRLCPSDKELFFMDTKVLCWNEYLLNYILGIRHYYLKDHPSTLPRARRVLTYFYIADCLFKLLCGMFIVYLMYLFFH